MKNTWTIIPLGEVLRPISRPELINPAKMYRILGAHWYAEGLYVKGIKLGSEIQADKIYRVELGDFVYNRLFAWKGSFAIVTVDNHGDYVSNEFPCFIVNQELANSKYLWRYFSRISAWEEALSLSAGGTPTSRNRLKEEKLLAMQIPLPPLEEQRRIVARIEELAAKIEEARGLRRNGVEEMEALVSVSLSRIFDYHASDKLPDEWIWQPFNNLLSKKEGITTGPFGTLLQKADIQSEGIPILGIANVQTNCFMPGFSDYVSQSKAEFLSSYKLEVDDIVIARSGTVGRSCVIPSGIDPKPIMSTNLIRLRLNTKIFLPKLLCSLFNDSLLIKRHKDSECHGSTRAFFTQKILSRLWIPVPPLSEQQRIVAYLDDLQAKVDALKQVQAETHAELDALLRSILDKAFRGELV